jgi:hypothetical protein
MVDENKRESELSWIEGSKTPAESVKNMVYYVMLICLTWTKSHRAGAGSRRLQMCGFR